MKWIKLKEVRYTIYQGKKHRKHAEQYIFGHVEVKSVDFKISIIYFTKECEILHTDTGNNERIVKHLQTNE